MGRRESEDPEVPQNPNDVLRHTIPADALLRMAVIGYRLRDCPLPVIAQKLGTTVEQLQRDYPAECMITQEIAEATVEARAYENGLHREGSRQFWLINRVADRWKPSNAGVQIANVNMPTGELPQGYIEQTKLLLERAEQGKTTWAPDAELEADVGTGDDDDK